MKRGAGKKSVLIEEHGGVVVGPGLCVSLHMGD